MTGHITDESKDIHSAMIVFPSKLSSDNNYNYLYNCEYSVGDSSYLVMLEANYSQKAFDAEKKRLADLKVSFKMPDEMEKRENKIMYDDKLFCLPAYVAIYNSHLAFEYALIDEENNSVIYVFFQQYAKIDGMDEKYLPLEFQNDSKIKYKLSNGEPNIYCIRNEEGVDVWYNEIENK